VIGQEERAYKYMLIVHTTHVCVRMHEGGLAHAHTLTPSFAVIHLNPPSFTHTVSASHDEMC
jgi:hypothetical protein